MPMLQTLFAVLALLAFLLGIWDMQPTRGKRLNWVSVGHAFVVLTYLLRRI